MDAAQAPNPSSGSSTAVTGATLGVLAGRLELPAPPAAVATPEIQQRPEESTLLTAWPPAAQLVTGILLGVVGTGLAFHWFSSTRGAARPADLDRAYRVDLNRAGQAELRQLPGIGPRLAERIEEYRHTHGPFRRVEDLRKVPGIGPGALDRVRDLVCVGPDEAAGAEDPPRVVAPTKQRPAASKKESALAGVVIDVNRAPLADLQRLPGIGPKLSQRIVDERARRPFRTVEELRRVPGIGPKTLERLRPYVTAGGGAAEM